MTPERLKRLREVLDRRQPDLTVITGFVHKQRNLSAVVRICDAIGIPRVHAVLGDEDYRAFRGTAMGSQLWVEVNRYRGVAGAVDAVRAQGMQVIGAHPAEDAVDFRDIDFTRPTALMLGAEQQGLDAEMQRACDACVAVPMVGMVASLNVSVAAGIILAEAQHQRVRAGLYDQPRLDEATYRRLFFEWAHPAVREFCHARGLRYPDLDDEGEIVDAPGWYAAVRAGNAARWGETRGSEERAGE